MKARIVGLPDGGVQLTLDSDVALSAFVTAKMPSSQWPNALVDDYAAMVFRRRVLNALLMVGPGSDNTVLPPDEPGLAIVDIDEGGLETETWVGSVAELVDDNTHDPNLLHDIAMALITEAPRWIGIGRSLRVQAKAPP